MSREPLPRAHYHLVLRPEKTCTDPVRSLRRLLKLALRQCGLRATSVEELAEPGAKPSEGG